MHNEGEQITVRLTGAGPYGLRLRGGDSRGEPLVVAKLHKRSKARAAGARVGDVLLSINGNRCHGMSQQAAYDHIDYSRDLTLQLMRFSDDYIDHETPPPSHSQPQQPSSRSLTTSPFLSASEAASTSSAPRSRPYSTELFRHEVRHDVHFRQVSPQSAANRGRHDRFAQPEAVAVDRKRLPVSVAAWKPVEIVVEDGGSFQLDERKSEEEDGGRKWRPEKRLVESDSEQRFTVTRKIDAPAGGSHKWTPKTTREPNESTSGHAEWPHPVSQPTEPTPSFLPKQHFSAKPTRWQPTAHAEPRFEPQPLRPESAQPVDDFAHEVVIWSSKPTVTNRDDVDAIKARKPLPWATEKKAAQPSVAKETVEDKPRAPAPWQPSKPDVSHQNEPPKPVAWQPPPSTFDTPVARTTENNQKSLPWQRTPVQSDSSRHVEDVREKSRATAAAAPSSHPPAQHRWQPPQQPSFVEPEPEVGASQGGPRLLEEPTRPSADGSVSPVVTSLFLRRVVTDGSAVAAGTGSDVDAAHDSLIAGKKNLYGDSSFYEDPEHTYPTIQEQIKMARKVALLLTSPANKNARGQRMFLKRKEQSSKWVIDTRNIFASHPLITTPQHPYLHPEQNPDDFHTLNQEEVERLRFHGEKSRHDVIPFDICSMLAAELREEKGRGGRLFAKRRDQADRTSAPESTGLVRVVPQEQPPAKQLPESNRKFVPEVVSRVPPPVKPQPGPVSRDEVEGRGDLAVPVNRLKGMVNPPKARITPWDSAVEYGTVEPAFEHLRGYLPGVEAAEETTQPDRAGSRPTFDQRSHDQGQGLNETYGYQGYQGQENKANVGPTAPYDYQNTPNYDSIATGFGQTAESSSFLRQAAAAVDRKGYRPVHFQVGARSFN